MNFFSRVTTKNKLEIITNSYIIKKGKFNDSNIEIFYWKVCIAFNI